MLLGMAAYKSGYFTGEWDDRRYRRVAVWGIALGLAGFAVLVAADMVSGFYIPVILAGFMTAVAPFRILMAVGYAALFVLLPLVPLQRYYAQNVADGLTNERFFRLLAEIEASRPNDELVIVDFQLGQESLGGGGTALRTLDFMLSVRDIPHTERDIEPRR